MPVFIQDICIYEWPGLKRKVFYEKNILFTKMNGLNHGGISPVCHLYYKHGITVGKEAIFPGNCLTVSIHNTIITGKCRNEHEKR